MIGGIYSAEKCPVCGNNLKNNGRGMSCPVHPECRSDKGIYVKFKGITKRFDGDYEGAERFVIGLRFKVDEDTFDRRDYAADQPLGFDNLISKWLEYKREDMISFRNILQNARVAALFFKNKNIKEIDYGDLEDFVKSLKDVKAKTRHNYLSTIHHFFTWCKRRRYIVDIPEFPVIKFKLGYRNVIGKETQMQLIEEIRRICPFKVYLAIKFLATYINVRPKEMRSLQEGHINLESGYLTFIKPKDKDYKTSPLTEEDIEVLKRFPVAMNREMLFFRKENGAPFGKTYLWHQWKRACRNLGIEGVDLYGGTRHSSAMALRDHFSPEQIKRAVGSATNQAFERYYKIEGEEIRRVFSCTSGEKMVRKVKPVSEVGNISK